MLSASHLHNVPAAATCITTLPPCQVMLGVPGCWSVLALSAVFSKCLPTCLPICLLLFVSLQIHAGALGWVTLPSTYQ
jgi:hypothetical protein